MKEIYNAFDEPDRLLFRVACGFYILLCWLHLRRAFLICQVRRGSSHTQYPI